MFKIHPFLKAFLKQKKMYRAFILNIIFSECTLRQSFFILKSLKNPDKLAIFIAFPWHNTVEGYDVWSDLSNDWTVFYLCMVSNGYMNRHNSDLD